eukprot:TRINITY_DN8717_c0_g1_i1.p1 TRINITY_DN8717_c0_g1~~TRINITY_DN8717_c0_g1_i1.p1  ORF type:complete len:279 (-),score=66.86 TRINITY_DN8717_c0_g1_i1:65-901(-)
MEELMRQLMQSGGGGAGRGAGRGGGGGVLGGGAKVQTEKQQRHLQAATLAMVEPPLSTPCPFTVGQWVMWKKHLRNTKVPKDGRPALVVDVLSEPLLWSRPVASEEERHRKKKKAKAQAQRGAGRGTASGGPRQRDVEGSHQFRVPVDFALAVHDSDVGVIMYYFNSHRFEACDITTLSQKDQLKCAKLRELYDRYSAPLDYAVGDTVKWKDDLKGARLPPVDYLCGCVALYPKGTLTSHEDNLFSNGFRQSRDGAFLMDVGGEYEVFHLDPQRFCKA